LQPSRQIIVLAFIVASLAACGWFQGAPESRAKDFIEILVVDPHDGDRLRALANAPDTQLPAELVQGMAADVALDYLRAKHEQGIAMNFSFGKTHTDEKNYRRVPVVVTLSDVKPVQHYRVQFMVELKKDAKASWRIHRVWASD
jgi:hypothetical protein